MMKLAREDEKDIKFEPGTKWQYSNTGMMVLGKVIEIASGQTYFDYVRENIHKPAGMTNTDCYELDKINTNLAVGYEKRFSDAGTEWVNNVFAHVMRGGPQGGGYSTVEDLLKFDQALRSGKLVSTATFQTVSTPKPDLNSPEYGYGFFFNKERNVTGHSGGFLGISSNLDMYLGSGWTAIVMSNYGRGSQAVSQKIQELIAATAAK
jgi:CubicO group peptidase (beta-lactamase class C family)